MKCQRLLACVVGIVCIALLFNGISAADFRNTTRSITVVVPPDFPPTYFRDEKSGKAAGFAVDVMDELARRAGFKVVYIFGKPWDEINEMLLAGKADIIPSVTVSAERQEKFLFSDPVATSPVNLIIPAHNAKITSLIPGITVGAIKGSVAEHHLRADTSIRIKTFGDMKTLLFELLSGRVDAVLTATPNFMQLAYEAKVDDKIKVVSPPVIEGKRAMAVRKDDVALLNALNAAIDGFIGSPEYQKLYVKWYGRPVQFWTVEKVGIASTAAVVMLVVGMAFWRYRVLTRLNRDLTASIQERSLAEVALQQSNAKMHSIFRSAPVGIGVVSNRVISDANERLCFMTGYTREELVGQSARVLYPTQKEFDYVGSEKYRQIRAFGTGTVETRWITKSGDIRYILLSSTPIDLQDYSRGVTFSALDITERKKAEDALRWSEERMRLFFERQLMGMAITSPEKGWIQVNDKLCSMLWYSREELARKTWAELTHPDDLESDLVQFERLISGEIDDYAMEKRFIRKDGEIVFTNLSVAAVRKPDGSLDYVMALLEDITSRKRAEKERELLQAQLLQSQKIESVGRLAGGVAHDYNNMLAVIFIAIELIRMKLPADSSLVEHIDEIEHAATRSRDITRQLLAFSRKQLIAPQPVNLNELISEISKSLMRLIGEDIELRCSLQENLKSVMIDPVQFDQMLVNLAVNARDAMPHGGMLNIETSEIEFTEDFCRVHAGYREGSYVQLNVSDTGTGMDRETLEHIFEPFFTTKEIGKGTGLGLATIYGIIKQNHGFVDVYSEPEHGTTFKIYFPRLEHEVHLEEQRSIDRILLGHEEVLLVEDDAILCASTQKMLESIGYRVTAVTSPADALELVRQKDFTFDLLLTDVVLTGMNGKQLSNALAQYKPGIRTVFMSGYTVDAIVHRGVLDPGICFLQKPFLLQELASTIRKALEAR